MQTNSKFSTVLRRPIASKGFFLSLIEVFRAKPSRQRATDTGNLVWADSLHYGTDSLKYLIDVIILSSVDHLIYPDRNQEIPLCHVSTRPYNHNVTWRQCDVGFRGLDSWGWWTRILKLRLKIFILQSGKGRAHLMAKPGSQLTTMTMFDVAKCVYSDIILYLTFLMQTLFALKGFTNHSPMDTIYSCRTCSLQSEL